MQHIPFALHRRAEHPAQPLNVVILPENEYLYTGPFDTFPGRHGFKLVQGARVDVLESYEPFRSLDHRLRLIQEWGFFGLLEEWHKLRDMPFDRQTFIIPATTKSPSLVTTADLQSLWITWELLGREMAEPSDSARTLHTYINLVARHLRQIFPAQGVEKYENIYSRSRSSAGPQTPNDILVGLSVQVLLEFLHGLVRVQLAEEPESEQYPYIGPVPFLINRLRDAGWCPWEIVSLRQFSGNGASFMLLASSDDRTVPERIHAPHPSSPEACQCEIFDNSGVGGCTYQVHVHEVCPGNCVPTITQEQWSAVDAQVESLVKDGSIPTLVVAQNEANNITISVQSAAEGPDQSYIAISHVWTDGLGARDDENVLPCLLLRVQEYVNHMADMAMLRGGRENVPFWLDTICIPRFSEHLRKSGLSGMAMIYRRAATVLVLDRAMYSTPIDCERAEIRLFRSAFIKWANRGWTIEEGGFARNLSRQFLEEALDFESTLAVCIFAKKMRNLEQRDMTRGFEDRDLRELQARIYVADPFIAPSFTAIGEFDRWLQKDITPETRINVLRELYIKLGRRVLTKPSDEPFIIASLLRMDLPRSSIFSAPTLKSLLLSFEQAPAELLLYEGPRFDQLCYRWIPRSFFRTVTSVYTPMDSRQTLTQNGFVSPRGLIVTFSGVRFSLPHDWRQVDPGECHVRLGTDYYRLAFDSRAMTSHWNATRVPEKLAVLVMKPEIQGYGVLVSILDDAVTVLYVFFEAVIKIHKCRGPPMNSRAVTGRLLQDQEWCVG